MIYVLLTSLFLIVSYLFTVAFYLGIDYYDTFFIFLNSRMIANLSSEIPYNYLRGSVPSLFYSPFFWIEKTFNLSQFAFQASHLFTTGLFTGLLWALYRFFRLHFNRLFSLFSVLLFALNPLIIHAAPFCKEDIPGTLFTVLAFFFYLKSHKNKLWRNSILCGLFIGATISSRYNLIPMLFLIIFIYEIVSGRVRQWKQIPVKILCLFVLPMAFFFLMPMIIYPLVGVSTPLAAPVEFVTHLKQNLTNIREFEETPMQNYVFLWKSFTPSLIFLSLLGFILSWRRERKSALFHTVVFTLLFVFHTYFVDHKEARYLFQLFPSLYFFITIAVQHTLSFIKDKSRNLTVKRIEYVLFFILILFLPIRLGFAELLKFTDPVYHVNYEKVVSDHAQKLSGDDQIYWIGVPYSIKPKDHVFDVEDEYTYQYDFFLHVVQFYAGKEILRIQGAKLKPVTFKGRKSYFVGGIGKVVKDGDVLIINSPGAYKDDSDRDRYPLMIKQVRQFYFDPIENPEPGTPYVYFAVKNINGLSARIRDTPEGLVIQGVQIPEGYYQLYIKAVGEEELLVSSIFPVKKDGKFAVLKKNIETEAIVEGLVLMRFDNEKEFYPPI